MAEPKRDSFACEYAFVRGACGVYFVFFFFSVCVRVYHYYCHCFHFCFSICGISVTARVTVAFFDLCLDFTPLSVSICNSRGISDVRSHLWWW